MTIATISNGEAGSSVRSKLNAAIGICNSFFAPASLNGTGSVDDGAAIQAAIDAAETAGGGFVILPPGLFRVDATVVIKNKVGLIGSGRYASILKAKTALNAPVIINHVSTNGTTDPNAEMICIADLQVDGNKANQTTGNRYGIFLTTNPLTTKASGDIDFDTHQLVKHVIIANCGSHGFYQTGRGESVLLHVWAHDNDGHGIFPTYDSFVIGCTASWSGLTGFYSDQSSIKYVNCKAFYNGQGTVTGENGSGFTVYYNNTGCSFNGCEAQDNAGAGFALIGSSGSMLAGCVADSNSSTHVNAGVSAGAYAGFLMWDANNNILTGCLSVERKAYGTNYQLNAVSMNGTTVNNTVELQHYGAIGTSGAVSTAVTGTSTANNKIKINQQDGSQTVAYAATLTPDPYKGTFNTTLTGNVTFAAPSNAHIGCRLSFLIKQDATGGRTIAWNSAYKFMSTWTATTTANGYSSVTFEYNGTDWVEVR